MNETSDPLSISSIDTDPFDVYSYPPGKLGIFEIGVSVKYMISKCREVVTFI